MDLQEILERGLIIAFDRAVAMADFNPLTLQVQVQHRDRATGLLCWCDWQPKGVEGLKMAETCNLDKGFDNVNDPFVEAVRWFPSGAPQGLQGELMVRVLLHGDLIADKDGRGVDGNHLPPWLPSRKTGDGIEGGMFESWFITDFRRG
jgi:hypothetical protein